METALGKGIGSRLWPLRAEHKLAYTVDARLTQMRCSDMLELYLKTDNEKRAEAEQALNQVITELYENGLSDGLSGLVGLISGGQRDEYDYHKMIFDEDFLRGILTQIGFSEVRLWDWRTTEHANIDDFSQAYIPHMDKEHGKLMSLNIEAVK
jgi:predicted Zn-dependent peptidase